jgi:flavin reductase (DIM6/NTAB) family NADH-FMN oxidoreductase RutF
MSVDVSEWVKRITTGVYVVGATADQKQNAFTAAWVMPASFQPLLLVVSINPHHSSYAMIKASGVFSINVLGTDQLDLAAHFGAPAVIDKLAGVAWSSGKTGAPLLNGVVAHFECEVFGESPAGDHVLVLGRVIGGSLLRPAGEPLSYRDTGDMDGASSLFPTSLELEQANGLSQPANEFLH